MAHGLHEFLPINKFREMVDLIKDPNAILHNLNLMKQYRYPTTQLIITDKVTGISYIHSATKLIRSTKAYKVNTGPMQALHDDLDALALKHIKKSLFEGDGGRIDESEWAIDLVELITKPEYFPVTIPQSTNSATSPYDIIKHFPNGKELLKLLVP